MMMAMRLYLFWSETDFSVFALTAQPDGHNLPLDLGPWSKNGEGEPICAAAGSGALSNAIVRAVQRDGLYLARTS
jgi:hypothetical protein